MVHRADLAGFEHDVGFVIDGVGTAFVVVLIHDTVVADFSDRTNNAVVRLPGRSGTVDLVPDALSDQSVPANPFRDVLGTAAAFFKYIKKSKRIFDAKIDGPDVASSRRTYFTVIPGEEFSLRQGTKVKPQFRVSLSRAEIRETDQRSMEHHFRRTIFVDNLAVAEPTPELLIPLELVRAKI